MREQREPPPWLRSRAIALLVTFWVLAAVLGGNGVGAQGSQQPTLLLDLISFNYPNGYTISREYVLTNATIAGFPWAATIPTLGARGHLIYAVDGCNGIDADIGEKFSTLQPKLPLVGIIHGLGPTDPALVANATKTKSQAAIVAVNGTGTAASNKTVAGNTTSSGTNATTTGNSTKTGPQWTGAVYGS
ncbi:hypothetical protein HDU93_002826, partial [Gonapodya sp. JEL0774]